MSTDLLEENSGPLNPYEFTLIELGNGINSLVYSELAQRFFIISSFSFGNASLNSKIQSELVLTLIIPVLIRNSIALTNSVSEIASVAHQPAVFFTQSGTD